MIRWFLVLISQFTVGCGKLFSKKKGGYGGGLQKGAESGQVSVEKDAKKIDGLGKMQVIYNFSEELEPIVNSLNDLLVKYGSTEDSKEFILLRMKKGRLEPFTSYELFPDYNYKDRLLSLSLHLNQLIKNFEQETGANIFVCNTGYRQYPERFPNQDKLQLLDLLRREDYSNLPHE